MGRSINTIFYNIKHLKLPGILSSYNMDLITLSKALSIITNKGIIKSNVFHVLFSLIF